MEPGRLCKGHRGKFVYIPRWDLYAARANRKISRQQTVLFRTIRDLFHKKTYQEVIFPFSGRSRFDIVVPELNLIVEFDGAQHFKYIKFFSKSKARWEEYKENDEQKEECAKKQGYIVVRFSYIEDLSPERVKNKLLLHLKKYG